MKGGFWLFFVQDTKRKLSIKDCVNMYKNITKIYFNLCQILRTSVLEAQNVPKLLMPVYRASTHYIIKKNIFGTLILHKAQSILKCLVLLLKNTKQTEKGKYCNTIKNQTETSVGGGGGGGSCYTICIN